MNKFLFGLLFLMGCINTPTDPIEHYNIQISPNINFTQLSTKRYQLVLDTAAQTVRQITAITTAPDLTKFGWDSNQIWDYIFESDTIPVKTINEATYSYKNQVSTVISPVRQMRGDSMRVVVYGVGIICSDTIWIILK